MATAIFGVVGVIMMVVGGRSIIDGTMTLGGFVMYIFFTGLVAAPIMQIASIGTQITEAFAGPRSHPRSDERRHRGRRRRLTRADGSRRRAKSYSTTSPSNTTPAFPSERRLLSRIFGLDDRPGRLSGSGKSTLISLVMTFNRPKSGRILVDGRDLAHVRLRDYRSHLGIVLQDNFLFDGSIAENISYGRPGATLRPGHRGCAHRPRRRIRRAAGGQVRHRSRRARDQTIRRASGSASPSPAPFSPTRPSSFSTKRRPAWTAKVKHSSRTG